jgi:hypothetical protein
MLHDAGEKDRISDVEQVVIHLGADDIVGVKLI